MARFGSQAFMTSKRAKGLLFLAVTAFGMAIFDGPAQADFIFTPGNNPGPLEENILFQSKYFDITSFIGHSNQTNVPINFNLLTGLQINGLGYGETGIGTNGVGQSDIICTLLCGPYAQGGANGQQLQDLEVSLGNGFGATDFIGNLDFGEGTALITVSDQLGGSFGFTLGNGQNFFTINAINGEVITDIKITEFAPDANGNFGWNSFKQPRISGLCRLQGASCQSIPVPEPSSLAIFGAGVFAFGWFNRKKVRFTA